MGRPPELERLSGVHCVLEALRARRRRLDRLLVRRDRSAALAGLVAEASRAGVPVEAVDPARIAREAGGAGNPQGVVLLAGPLPEASLESLCAAPAPRRLVALDGVEDPRNVGAIMRVAEASGAAGLVLTRRRAPPLNAVVARASAGAAEWLPVARVPNLARALESLRERGFWVLGAEPAAPTSLFQVPGRWLEGDLVVLLGAEGRGLRRGVERVIDHPVRIPTPGRVASLNVASAAAVVLFELLRRASSPPGGEAGEAS
jgi:23S rRNA (guanosine2251-2'-O)-methyltransferase